MRKVAVITGTRADYGIYRSVLEAMESHPKLEAGLIVTGMHLSPKFGLTIDEIKKDGFLIEAEIPILSENDSGAEMANAIGKAILGFSEILSKNRPDFVLLLGDRGEMLAGAIAAAHLNIPVAHMHGGEVSGTIDESVRHAVSKFAHLHFAATDESARRLIKMGENKRYVFVVGAAGLDKIVQAKYPEPEIIGKELGLDLGQPVILCIQHPVTTEVESAGFQMEETMQALESVKAQTVLIYPNSDAGHELMLEVISNYEGQSWLKVFKSLSHDHYLGLLRIARVLVGNSSSGIIEAPSFGLPVVNIGTRQQGRQQGNNVLNVGYSRHQIKTALKKALYDEDFREYVKSSDNPYGNGYTGKKVAAILAEIQLDKDLLQKMLYFD